ncbi:hypothetical protein [Acetobacter okinawensis]|uniref:hypothetical protein n=1 Tax=Acetobacter okinawensis TaxID=1076594 RepID=UPI00209D9B02|nr:hypothetical protein [Acetobacter okinawensis]MCP1213799.1 hypothetical protein [Acetobacter okinawensis]
MRGNVMSIQQDTSGVTMLRTSGGNIQEAAKPEARPDVQDVSRAPSEDKNQTRTRLSQEEDIPQAANLSGRFAKYRKPGLLLLASVAVVAFGTYQAGFTPPLMGHNATKPTMIVPKIQNTSSGLTPPDLVTTASNEVTHNPALVAGPQNNTPMQLPSVAPIPQSPAVPAVSIANPPTIEAKAAPEPASTPGPSADVHSLTDTHIQDRMAMASSLNDVHDTQASHQDVGSDRLFIEMHKQLDIMSNQMKELQDRLESTQQALNERVSTGLGKIDGRLDELQHREDLLETQKKTEPQPGASPVQSKVSTPVAEKSKDVTPDVAEHHSAKKSTKSPVPAPAPLPHYTVQAGAPDIAILMDSSGTPLRVQPGTSLDGWGNVLSVSASGNGWVVKTEHGTIR